VCRALDCRSPASYGGISISTVPPPVNRLRDSHLNRVPFPAADGSVQPRECIRIEVLDPLDRPIVKLVGHRLRVDVRELVTVVAEQAALGRESAGRAFVPMSEGTSAGPCRMPGGR